MNIFSRTPKKNQNIRIKKIENQKKMQLKLINAVMGVFSGVVCGRLRQWQRQRRPRPQGCAALRSALFRTVARLAANPPHTAPSTPPEAPRESLRPPHERNQSASRPRIGSSRRWDLHTSTSALSVLPTPPTFARLHEFARAENRSRPFFAAGVR